MISEELINKYKLDEEELDLLNEENDIFATDYIMKRFDDD